MPALALAACADGDDEPTTTTAAVTTTDAATTVPDTMDDTTVPTTTGDTMTGDTMTDVTVDDTAPDTMDDTMTDVTVDDTTVDDTMTGEAAADEDLLSALDGNGADVFRTLLPIVGLDGLTDADEVTIFVPGDEAFASLEGDELTSLIEDPERVLEVLQAHVVEGMYTGDDLEDGDTLTAISGAELPVTVDGDTITIGQATVTRADVTFDGGVLHLIDDVLLL